MSSILFVIDSMRRGGKERQLFELLKGLSASGRHRLHLLVLGGDIEFDGLEGLGVTVYRVTRKTRYCVSSCFKIARIIRECRPTVVNSWTIMGTFYAFLPTKFIGARFVDSTIQNTFLEPRNLLFRAARRLLFHRSDYVVSNSREGLNVWGMPINARNHVIYNGVDPERFLAVGDPLATRRELGITLPWVVGMVANFTPKKDYETFFKAAEIILSRRRDVAFLAIGDGPERARYLDHFSDRLGRDIFMPGKINAVERYIMAFDIGVLSTPREGISNSILEYCACGKAVVATGEGGTAEIIRDQENGRLLPAGQPEALAEAILDLLGDDDKRARFAENASRSIRERFSFSSMIAKYATLYE